MDFKNGSERLIGCFSSWVSWNSKPNLHNRSAEDREASGKAKKKTGRIENLKLPHGSSPWLLAALAFLDSDLFIFLLATSLWSDQLMLLWWEIVKFSSVAQLCPALCILFQNIHSPFWGAHLKESDTTEHACMVMGSVGRLYICASLKPAWPRDFSSPVIYEQKCQRQCLRGDSRSTVMFLITAMSPATTLIGVAP